VYPKDNGLDPCGGTGGKKKKCERSLDNMEDIQREEWRKGKK